MMRALYTGATGMISEQTNVDTIANNLANVNTCAYVRQQVVNGDKSYNFVGTTAATILKIKFNVSIKVSFINFLS